MIMTLLLLGFTIGMVLVVIGACKPFNGITGGVLIAGGLTLLLSYAFITGYLGV